MGERYAEFIPLVVGRQWRRPRWVTAQEPPTPPMENGDAKGWILYRREGLLTVWKEQALSQYASVGSEIEEEVELRAKG